MLSGGGRGRVRRLLRVVWKVHEARGSWVVDQSLLVVLLIVSVSLKLGKHLAYLYRGSIEVNHG